MPRKISQHSRVNYVCLLELAGLSALPRSPQTGQRRWALNSARLCGQKCATDRANMIAARRGAEECHKFSNRRAFGAYVRRDFHRVRGGIIKRTRADVPQINGLPPVTAMVAPEM